MSDTYLASKSVHRVCFRSIVQDGAGKPQNQTSRAVAQCHDDLAVNTDPRGDAVPLRPVAATARRTRRSVAEAHHSPCSGGISRWTRPRYSSSRMVDENQAIARGPRQYGAGPDWSSAPPGRFVEYSPPQPAVRGVTLRQRVVEAKAVAVVAVRLALQRVSAGGGSSGRRGVAVEAHRRGSRDRNGPIGTRPRWWRRRALGECSDPGCIPRARCR